MNSSKILCNDVKLDSSDVLIVPRQTNMISRKNPCLKRTFNFNHTGKSWTGIPISVSNMDTTGTFEMALEAAKYNLMTCIHKYYNLEDWLKFIQDVSVFENNLDIFNNKKLLFCINLKN